MRKTFQYAFCLLILLLATGSLWAKDKYTVTVLPFTLNSADKTDDFMKKGISEMISTRISVPNKIEVTDKDVVLAELKKSNIKEISLSDVYKLGNKLKSDYVVWGSINKIGNTLSIDGKLVDIVTSKSDIGIFTQSQNLDEVMPKINDFSQKIVQHILGTSASVQQSTPTVVATGPSKPIAPGGSRESQIIAGMKTGGKKGTLTSAINSDYINATDPSNRRGFWMSQKFTTEFKGMDIGDVNGDGLNEVVVIDINNVYIYQKTEKDMKLLEKIAGNSYDNYLAVDVADINKDGIKQIFVTSLNNTTLDSFVLEFKDGKYVKIASDVRWFLRVLDTTSAIPILIGQKFGHDKPFDTPIYEIVWKDGKYVEDEKKKIPLGLSVYGLVIDNFGTEGGGEKIIALDDLDYLCIFEKTNKPLSRIFTYPSSSEDLIWRSDEQFGGSNNYFEDFDKTRPENKEKSAFVDLRIHTYDTNNDGKKEVIIAKNLDSTGRAFKRAKFFTSSEIYNLEWDGVGMSENWRTKKIKGYVVDSAIKDIDNDGKPEIVLALIVASGGTKSVIVVYKLDTAQ